MIDTWQREPISYTNDATPIELNLDLFDVGVSQTADFLIYRSETTIKIYDRVCNHNNGRLGVREGLARCPLHGWTLDLESGQYKNVNCTKNPLLIVEDQELESPLISVTNVNERIELKNFESRYATKVEFMNHACLYFEVEDSIKFATDPWVIGPAFSNGWWLRTTSPRNVFEKLNACDFIYISHNHPDHLHPLSLSHIRKDMPILTGDFEGGSTVRYLRTLGFTHVVALDFRTRLVDPDRDIALTVLKSGDFRNDSGLLVEIGDFTCVLTVDCNFFDFGRFPKSVDLLCSAFAGGASGFPICFENYSEAQKQQTTLRSSSAAKASTRTSIESCRPSYFMPYAGSFVERAARDKYVRQMNAKNAVEDFLPICDEHGSSLLNLTEKQQFEFFGNQLVSSHSRSPDDYLEDLGPEQYIEQTRNSTRVLVDEEIERYFLQSGYHDDLIVKIELTTDDFSETHRQFAIEFDLEDCPRINRDVYSDEDYCEPTAVKRFLRLKIREYEFYDLLINRKPWEDLSIGFQTRVFRCPNIYNSKFWHHFTNTYTNDLVSEFSAKTTEAEA